MPQRSMETPEAPKERYTGHELDSESELYYAGARYLDPVIGRWMAVDPLADDLPGWSPYNYVLNNPIKSFDPDGAFPCPPCVPPQTLPVVYEKGKALAITSAATMAVASQAFQEGAIAVGNALSEFGGAVAEYGRGLVREDYSHGFAEEVASTFEPGVEIFDGELQEDLVLVQYHDADVEVGEGRSLKFWTTSDKANTRSMSTIEGVVDNLALDPLLWGNRNAVSVAVIPQGTHVTYAYGTARAQDTSVGTMQGGAPQYRFKNFNRAWVTETRRLRDEIGNFEARGGRFSGGGAGSNY